MLSATTKKRTTKRSQQKAKDLSLSVSQESLIDPLSLVLKAVNVRLSAAAIKRVVKLEADADAQTLSFQGQGEGAELTAVVPAVVEVGGAALAPVPLFADLIKRMRGADLTLTLTEQKLKINSYTIDCQFGADEYVPLPTGNAIATIEIPAQIVKEGLSQTMDCISKDPTKGILTGLCLSLTKGLIEFAATNGHSMAVRTFHCDTATEAKIVLPGWTLSYILSAIDLKGEVLPICLMIGVSSAIFRVGGVTLNLPLLRAEAFPDYPKLIPQKFLYKADLNRINLLSAVERLSVYDDVLRFYFSPEQPLEISVDGGDLGSASEKVLLQSIEHISSCSLSLPMKIGMDAKLLQPLIRYHSEEITICFNHAEDAVVFRPTGCNATFLVMPYKLRE